MPYTPRTWLEGDKGKAADLNRIEQAISTAAELVNVKEAPFSATGKGIADDTEAFKKAVESLPKEGGTGLNGGVIFLPLGVYLILGTISVSKLTGVRFLGSGGLSGGGALGVGAGVASSVLILENATRPLDFRSSVGCGMENMSCIARGEGLTGYILDAEGLSSLETTALLHFNNVWIEAARTLGGTKLIIAAAGVNLAKCNGCRFDNCVFSGCTYGVAGRVANAVESVAHTFEGCWFIGSQIKHVVNADCNWVFKGCVAEGLFNNKGEPKKEAGFLGYTEAAIKSRGVVLDGCWCSSNEAATRTGVGVEYRGTGLVIRGGEYACCETGVSFPEGPKGSTIMGVRFTKLNNGVAIAGKSQQSIIAGNTYTEVTEPLTDSTKEYEGCIIQEIAKGGASVASGEVKEPGAFKKGAQGFETEAEAKAIREELAKVVKVLKAVGLCK